MQEQRVKEIFAGARAIITGDHFVYTSGLHGPNYINKDAVYPRVRDIDELCSYLSDRFKDDNVDVVVAPAIGAIDLKTGVARCLSLWRRQDVLGIYGEHYEELAVDRGDDNRVFRLESGTGEPSSFANVPRGSTMFVKHQLMVIKRGYDKLVAGKRVLVVEDILTTGGSAREMVKAVRHYGGEVVGVGVLANRGGVTAADLGAEKLEALMSVQFVTYKADTCPLCASGVPINTELGHGKKFLAERAATTT